MSNEEYDEIVRLARAKQINLNQCPTCQSKETEVAPGVWLWPESPKYKVNEQEYDCDCERQKNLRLHYLLAGIPQHYWTLGEDDFFGDPKALAATREYLGLWDEWKRYGVGLQYYSATQGTGKTMLACLIGKELIKRRVKAQFISFWDAVRMFERSYEDRKSFEERLRNIPVLILDEVGIAISSAQRNLFALHFEALIRFRTDGNSVTIITTNMTPAQLDSEYPRIFSLLASKQKYVHVHGKDARKEVDWGLTYEHLIKTGEARPIK